MRHWKRRRCQRDLQNFSKILVDVSLCSHLGEFRSVDNRCSLHAARIARSERMNLPENGIEIGKLPLAQIQHYPLESRAAFELRNGPADYDLIQTIAQIFAFNGDVPRGPFPSNQKLSLQAPIDLER